MNRFQRVSLKTVGVFLTLALFTPTHELFATRPDALKTLVKVQETRRERYVTAWEEDVRRMDRTEGELKSLGANGRAWRIFRQRRRETVRRWRRGYATLLEQQIKQRATLAERIARGEPM